MHETSHPPILDEQLCFAVYSLSLAMNKAYRPLLKALALTYPQYLVMMVLWEQDAQYVSAIGEQLFLDSATLTPLLKRLASTGLVRRERASHDERHVIIRLTDAGVSLKTRAGEVMATMLGQIGCSLDEANSLRERLTQLRQRLLLQAE